MGFQQGGVPVRFRSLPPPLGLLEPRTGRGGSPKRDLGGGAESASRGRGTPTERGLFSPQLSAGHGGGWGGRPDPTDPGSLVGADPLDPAGPVSGAPDPDPLPSPFTPALLQGNVSLWLQ